MDKLKEKIEEIVNKIKTDKELGAKFKKNPTETIENLIGVDVPDDKVEAVITGRLITPLASYLQMFELMKDVNAKLVALGTIEEQK